MIWNRCDEELALIETALLAVFEGVDIPSPLQESMAYSLIAGGKRLRPLLLLKSCRCFSQDIGGALSLACALEMIHTYSLIHDDLPAMDNDTLRRGRATNHVIYGEAMALLAGDGLLNLAYETMIRQIPPAQGKRVAYLRAMERIADAAGPTGMIAGQCMDINQTGHACTGLELEEMHRRKTGRLFDAALAGGAILGGAGPDELSRVEVYAEHMGMLFQIVDDILDVAGDEKTLGKSVGKDAAMGKCTYVTLLGMQGAKKAARTHAEAALLSADGFDREDLFFHDLIHDLMERNR